MPDDDRLRRYREKRDEGGPEPSGRGAQPAGDAPVFVVQEHDATNRHYDLRLEVDGVLVSWAVPKGPSTDPTEKRLAVRVEDHPLEYATFEGTIPAGEYGGGAVIVWDTGPYRNRTTHRRRERSMAEALEAGHVKVELEGTKLQGMFALTRTDHGRGKERWILVKVRDAGADARRDPVSTETASVTSGRTVEEVAATDDDRPGARSGAARGPGSRVDASAARPTHPSPVDVTGPG